MYKKNTKMNITLRERNLMIFPPAQVILLIHNVKIFLSIPYKSTIPLLLLSLFMKSQPSFIHAFHHSYFLSCDDTLPMVWAWYSRWQ